MLQLCLIGIGTGNPKHLTLEAVEAIRADARLLDRAGRPALAAQPRQQLHVQELDI